MATAKLRQPIYGEEGAGFEQVVTGDDGFLQPSGTDPYADWFAFYDDQMGNLPVEPIETGDTQFGDVPGADPYQPPADDQFGDGFEGPLPQPTDTYANYWESPDFRQQITNALTTGYGWANPEQIEYYILRASQNPDKDAAYWEQRAMGMGAGGADTATQGPYAGQDFGSLEYQQAGGSPYPFGSQPPGTIPLGGSFTGGSTSFSSQQSAPSTSGATDLASILDTLRGSIDLPGSNVDLDSILSGLLSGDLNEGMIDRRVSSARDTLERHRGAEMDTISSLLADRGLIGDGPEISALTGLSERMAGQFGQNVSDIYADESGRADQRMLAALSAATGMSQAEAQHLVNLANVATQRDLGMTDLNLRRDLGFGDLDLRQTLGLGDLGLRNIQTQLGNSQFLASLGLQRDTNSTNQLISLIQHLISIGAIGAGGTRGTT